MGVFSEDVGWLAFFVWRSPSGVEKDGKCVKRRATIRYGVEPGGRLVSPWWKLFSSGEVQTLPLVSKKGCWFTGRDCGPPPLSTARTTA